MVTIPYLDLDKVKADHLLMRLLPPEIAYRYHALPVATDGNRITVAVASPGESNASAAISSAISRPVCLVQADSQEIDQYLDKIWREYHPPRLRLLYWSSPAEKDITKQCSFHDLMRLFDADIIQVDVPWQGVTAFPELRNVIDKVQPDLFILPTDLSSWQKQVLFSSAFRFFFNQLTVPVFIPLNLCLPLEKILLVLPDSTTADETAILWTVQISSSNQAAVTVLPLLPRVPGLYGSFIKHNLKTILLAKDPLGQKMRSLAGQFSEKGIQGTFKLRDGEPNEQLRDELETSDPDLVIIATDFRRNMPVRKTGDPLHLMLKWNKRPLLITKDLRMERK